MDIHLKIIEFRSEAQDLEKTKSLVSNSRPAQHRDRVSSRRSADNHDKSSSHSLFPIILLKETQNVGFVVI